MTIWKPVLMTIWKSVLMTIWKSVLMTIWKSVLMTIWKSSLMWHIMAQIKDLSVAVILILVQGKDVAVKDFDHDLIFMVYSPNHSVIAIEDYMR